MDENVNENPFLFYITFYYKSSDNNLEVINPNKNNIIFYPIINNIQKHKSIAFYLNLNEIKYNNDLLIEVSFNNQYINDNINLNTLSALINDEFIFQNTINEQFFVQSPLHSKSYYDSKEKKIYYLFKMSEVNQFKKYFSYCFISFSNNIINYHNTYSQNNNLYVEIDIMPYNEYKLKNSVEIVNKYPSKNNEINNKNDEKEQNKSSFPTGLIIVLIIVFIIVILFLAHRFYRKKNISRMNDYFKTDFQNSN
jgi:hypothetical protein